MHASRVLFGPAPWAVATYAVIVSERINRAVVALLGGGAMILVGAPRPT
jgi:hypothetical protein